MLLALAGIAAALDLRPALVKPGKTLAVSVQVRGTDAAALKELSRELRTSCKAATLWADDVATVEALVSEQATALGDFPGPCPVIFDGAAEDRAGAISRGASAVVVDAAGDVGVGGDVSKIWRCGGAADASALAARGEGPYFLLDGLDDAADLPPEAVVVAGIDAMQPDHGEIDAGRAAQAAGARGVLLRGACVGDDEDAPYAAFAIGRLRTKKSTSFGMDGFTGSTNGHFGSPVDSDPRPWKRA